MKQKKVYTAIGLMSGTSMDGIDAALIRTDGGMMVEPLEFTILPYDPDVTLALRENLGRKSDPLGELEELERAVTLAQADVVRELMSKADLFPRDIDVIGFHGQTITHGPAEGFTWQLGDGALMAHELGIPVVNDFRGADMRAGGQGAPLVPLYHSALVAGEKLPRPVAVLNIGGVANVTWIGHRQNDIIAFDTGPGNALLDDFIRERTSDICDTDGALAMQGQIHQDFLLRWLGNPYFNMPPPKSLDRNDFYDGDTKALGNADGAATLTAFTIYAVEKAMKYFPAPPREWLVSGGGRLNPAIMNGLQDILRVPVRPVDELAWNGDLLEAEAFAYLAVRSRKRLPLSLPTTTGVPAPTTGGQLYLP